MLTGRAGHYVCQSPGSMRLGHTRASASFLSSTSRLLPSVTDSEKMPTFTSAGLSYKPIVQQPDARPRKTSAYPCGIVRALSFNALLLDKIKPKQDATSMVRVVSEIVAALVKAVEEGRSVNVLNLKNELCSKHGLAEQPKTVDIIAAIPEQYKQALLPLLKTKPIRTASGVRLHACAVCSCLTVCRLPWLRLCANLIDALT